MNESWKFQIFRVKITLKAIISIIYEFFVDLECGLFRGRFWEVSRDLTGVFLKSAFSNSSAIFFSFSAVSLLFRYLIWRSVAGRKIKRCENTFFEWEVGLTVPLFFISRVLGTRHLLKLKYSDWPPRDLCENRQIWERNRMFLVQLTQGLLSKTLSMD